MPSNTFNNFKIDKWYKGLIYFGGIIAFTGIFSPVEIFDNQNVTLFGLGFFLFGLSMWGNQKGAIFDENGKKIKVKESLKTRIKFAAKTGLSFIGIFFIFYSTYEIIKHYFI